MTSPYPPHGETPWDLDLKAYIDAQDILDRDYTDSQITGVNSALAGKQSISGLDAAVASRVSNPSSQTNDAIEALIGGVAFSPFFYPESYGAVGDGTTDDGAALRDCYADARAATGIVVLSKTYAWTGDVIHGGGVAVIGSRGSGLKALDSTSRYLYGAWITTTGAVAGDSSPGYLMGVTFDGNSTGKTSGLVRAQCVQGYIAHIKILNGAGHGMVWDAAQNSEMHAAHITGNLLDGLRLDNGSGGNAFYRCSVNGGTGGNSRLITFAETSGEANAYQVPTQNFFHGCIFETNLDAYAIADLRCGLSNVFDACLFSANSSAAMSSGYVIRVTSEDFPTFGNAAEFRSPLINGGTNGTSGLAGAFYFDAASRCRVEGRLAVNYVTYVFSAQAGSIVAATATIPGGGVVTGGTQLGPVFNPTAGLNGFSSWLNEVRGTTYWDISDQEIGAFVVKQHGDVTSRLLCSRIGTLTWFNGTDAVPHGKIESRAVGGLRITGDQQWVGGQIYNVTTVTAATGTVDVDGTAAMLTAIEFASGASVTVNLNVNGAHTDGRVVEILFKGNGTNTLAWTQTISWDGAAPAAPASGAWRSVRLAFVGSTGGWREVSRSG